MNCNDVGRALPAGMRQKRAVPALHIASVQISGNDEGKLTAEQRRREEKKSCELRVVSCEEREKKPQAASFIRTRNSQPTTRNSPPLLCVALRFNFFRDGQTKCKTAKPARLCFAALLAITASASAAIPANATVDQALTALQSRGKTLHAFTADLKLIETDTTFMTDTIRRGKVWFEQQPKTGARVHVLLNTREADKKPPLPERKEYLLEGNVLIDRTYRDKLEVDRQIAPAGQSVNLFQLGQGPFPLPIGQNPKSVQKNFDVTIVAPAKGDPANSIHLQLVPKPGTQLARKFSEIDIWVDRNLTMPVRIETIDVNNTTDRTTDLLNMKLNPPNGLPASDFTLPSTDATWNKHTEPYDQGRK